MEPFEIATVIYLGVVAILFVTKPEFIFDNPRIYHKFGLNQETDHTKTMMPLWLLFIILALIIYYTTITYIMINTK